MFTFLIQKEGLAMVSKERIFIKENHKVTLEIGAFDSARRGFVITDHCQNGDVVTLPLGVRYKQVKEVFCLMSNMSLANFNYSRYSCKLCSAVVEMPMAKNRTDIPVGKRCKMSLIGICHKCLVELEA
jgi:hypothetical protein